MSLSRSTGRLGDISAPRTITTPMRYYETHLVGGRASKREVIVRQSRPWWGSTNAFGMQRHERAGAGRNGGRYRTSYLHMFIYTLAAPPARPTSTSRHLSLADQHPAIVSWKMREEGERKKEKYVLKAFFKVSSLPHYARLRPLLGLAGPPALLPTSRVQCTLGLRRRFGVH